jgi:hypothetical protein
MAVLMNAGYWKKTDQSYFGVSEWVTLYVNLHFLPLFQTYNKH